MSGTRSRAGRVVARAGLLALVIATGAAGCSGEKRQTIEGSVSLKGQPLPSGVVQFNGPGDRMVTAVVHDGTFIATDLLPGEVKVAVVEDPSSTGGSRSGGMPVPRGSPPPPGGSAPAPQRVPIPTKYKDILTSGLSYTIDPDTKRIEIKLE